MKSKLKYYAQVIGINLLAALVPILAVVLIYGFGKLKNIYTHPCVLSQEIYDCCLEATVVVLAGFSVGLFFLAGADSWRKAKLRVLKGNKKREEEEIAAKICFAMSVEPTKDRVEPKVDVAERDSIPAFEDSEFEDILGLSAREIWDIYKGCKVYVRDLFCEDNEFSAATLAGYTTDNTLVIGFSDGTHIWYNVLVDGIMTEKSSDWHVEKGYGSYILSVIEYVRIIKR